LKTPLGWTRANLLLDGFYEGVETTPNSWADLVCQMVWWWRRREKVNLIKLQAAIAAKSDKTKEAVADYLETLSPSVGNEGEVFQRDLAAALAHWHEDAARFAQMRLPPRLHEQKERDAG